MPTNGGVDVISTDERGRIETEMGWKSPESFSGEAGLMGSQETGSVVHHFTLLQDVPASSRQASRNCKHRHHLRSAKLSAEEGGVLLRHSEASIPWEALPPNPRRKLT